MFASLIPTGLFRPARRPASSKRQAHQVQLRLTELEGRLTPTAPAIGSLAGENIGSNWIITGQLTAGTPSTTTVAITGTVSGSATVHADGSFEFLTSHTGGGTVTAEADNVDGSDTESTAVVADPGTLNPYLTMSVAYGSQKSITLSGNVYDDSPSGLTVTFNGAASGSATTDSSGHYSVALTASALGNVSGSVSNGHGLTSNTPTVALLSNAPVISDFTVTSVGSNTIHLRGRVTDESPAGLTVTFTSSIAAVNGKGATVGADGWFDLYLTVPPNTHGDIYVETTDWWGQDSNSPFTKI